MANIKVQLGFTADGVGAPFFTLNDPVKGVLDDVRYVLGGGEGLVDVSQHVREVIFSRGKSRDLGRYEPGSCSVLFNNQNRWFDPTYSGSPYYGQLMPKRQIVISVDNVVQFTGQVEDWNIEYDLSGNSVASCSGSDTLAKLANLDLTDYAPDQELTGARVNGVLDNVGWSATARSIDTGNAELIDQFVDTGTNALSYLGIVAGSEPGALYADRNGNICFSARDASGSSGNVIFGNEGIQFNGVRAVYGSELLYNRVTITNASSSFTAEDADSISFYGARDISFDTYLANDDDLEPMAKFLLAQYKSPEYRFEGIDIITDKLSAGNQTTIYGLDLGQYATVRFTPNGIPPEIVRYGKIVRIEQNHTPSYSRVSIGLQTSANPVFILDDPLLGKLDTGILGY